MRKKIDRGKAPQFKGALQHGRVPGKSDRIAGNIDNLFGPGRDNIFNRFFAKAESGRINQDGLPAPFTVFLQKFIDISHLVGTVREVGSVFHGQGD